MRMVMRMVRGMRMTRLMRMMSIVMMRLRRRSFYARSYRGR